MNDWRSTFDGANDHESDWEQCFVILEALPDGDVPAGLVLRGRPRREGRRPSPALGRPAIRDSPASIPIVYPGAGSHATYLERGEYIMSLPFPGEQNLHKPLDLFRGLWRDTLGQPDPGDLAGKVRHALSVPFVDYARGDGVAVGPGHGPSVDADPDRRRRPWVDGYRGLWGLDTGDRFAGERAPAGPKYTRTGSGAPGLVRPARLRRPGEGRAAFDARGRARGPDRRADRRTGRRGRGGAGSRGPMPALEQEVAALARPPGLERYAAARSAELAPTRPTSAAAPAGGRDDRGDRCAAGAGRRAPGGPDGGPACAPPPRVRPEPPVVSQRRAFGETWAALSVGLLIAALAVIVWFRILPPFLAIVVLVGAYLAIEAFFSRRVQGMVLKISMALAIVTALVLAVVFVRELCLPGCSRSGSCSSPTTSPRSAATAPTDRPTRAGAERRRRRRGRMADQRPDGRGRRRPPTSREVPNQMSIETKAAMSSQEIVALSREHTHLLVVRAGRPGPDRHRPGGRRLPLHARGPPDPRLQQPADVGQHRPRRPARHRRHHRPGD